MTSKKEYTTGTDEINRIADELKQIAAANPCGMGDTTMRILAHALRELINHAIAKDLSREQAANYLGVSTRTLGRLVDRGEIEPPKRHGFRRKGYSKNSLDAYIERQK